MSFQIYMLIFLAILSFYSLICDHVEANDLVPALKRQRVRCHDHEKEALLQFKQSFIIDCNASMPPPFYPKTKTWKEHVDCCTWDGVECDKETDYVIGLNLISSCLYGTFPSNSTLFSLDSLLELDLSYNDFVNSPIPSSVGRLYRLRSLKLFQSHFSGLIPLEISLLSSLTILNLSYNGNFISGDPYSLTFGDNGSLDTLVTNLTRLTRLNLDFVDISSVVPPVLSNMTSLTLISLCVCQLYGEVPHGIFQLPNLVALQLFNNQRLKGHLPEFHPHSPLMILDLQETGLSGELPSSIGNLGHLKKLAIYGCSFSGHLPASLGNLTELSALGLAYNEFTGTLPSRLTNLTNIEYLSLSGLDVSPMVLNSWLLKLNKLAWLALNNMNMYNTIPSNLANLTTLHHLDLQYNQLFGTLPQWFANLTQLTELLLGTNQLEGQVETWVSKLVNLQKLDLSHTNFVGMFEQVFKLPNLQELHLSNLDLTSLPNAIRNDSSFSKLTILDLSSCNLTEFPQVLRYQNELTDLSLSGNRIEGHVPQWFMDTTKESLLYLNLSLNSLVGFEHPLVFLPWINLEVLDLKGNKLGGPLPIPSNTTQVYDISNNHIYGAIPMQFCFAYSLAMLDLSNNSMRGHIPDCIGYQLGNSLQVLNLRGNSFHGTIPKKFYKSCSLKMINLSDNQLEGQLPRSLANCTSLEVLDLGKNRINDTFPSWLGSLSGLQVLVLRHNSFYGKIRDGSKSSFIRLRIIDLSHNFHVGTLPSSYFQSWRAMQVAYEDQSSSSNSIIAISYQRSSGVLNYIFYPFNYVITITNKGTETLYPRVLTVFRVVDFSNNNFTGKLSSFLGDLRGIQALNLSNNNLEGIIPPSLSKISDLQSLDVSQNKLSGVIPQDLTKLTFLEVFNVSYNRLVGSIPQGEQFDTFDNSSFEGNLALCGGPLSKMCGTLHPSPGLPSQHETNGKADESSNSIHLIIRELISEPITWIIIALGCASGFIVGFVLGKLYITDRHHGWFIKTFATKRKLKTRGRKASNLRRRR